MSNWIEILKNGGQDYGNISSHMAPTELVRPETIQRPKFSWDQKLPDEQHETFRAPATDPEWQVGEN
jgi:hypothetical protein